MYSSSARPLVMDRFQLLIMRIFEGEVVEIPPEEEIESLYPEHCHHALNEPPCPLCAPHREELVAQQDLETAVTLRKRPERPKTNQEESFFDEQQRQDQRD